MKHQKTADVMTFDVVSVKENTPFKEIAGLLAEHRISGLPVVDDDDKVIGVLSETDLLQRQARRDSGADSSRLLRRLHTARTSAAKSRALTARTLMSSPPVTVRTDDSVALGARVMTARRVERLPVLDEEDRLVGIVTRRDLLRVFLRPDDEIRSEIVQEVVVRTLLLAPQTVDVTVEDGVVTLAGDLERTSEVAVAGRATARIDGVLAVRNRLTARFDDDRVRPVPTAVHGVTEQWLRKL